MNGFPLPRGTQCANGAHSGAGYGPGTTRTKAGSFLGFSLSIAGTTASGKARPCFRVSKKSDLRPWLLLASARLRHGASAAQNETGFLAAKAGGERHA
jgi:hypothetical protein